jgi:hypothetical protein
MYKQGIEKKLCLVTFGTPCRYEFINHIRLFVRERLVHLYNDLLTLYSRMLPFGNILSILP